MRVLRCAALLCSAPHPPSCPRLLANTARRLRPSRYASPTRLLPPSRRTGERDARAGRAPPAQGGGAPLGSARVAACSDTPWRPGGDRIKAGHRRLEAPSPLAHGRPLGSRAELRPLLEPRSVAWSLCEARPKVADSAALYPPPQAQTAGFHILRIEEPKAQLKVNGCGVVPRSERGKTSQ